jgi:hypothetical protein
MEHLIQRMGIRIITLVTRLSKDCLAMCRAILNSISTSFPGCDAA